MTYPQALSDFAGRWSVTRRITDHSGGPYGRFEGHAMLTPGQTTELLYAETGQLRLGDMPPFQAERRYLWRADGSAIATFFEDGRPFHRIALGAAEAHDLHDCPPDTYRVRYEFGAWPDTWTAFWDVTGPRKDYSMISEYQRG